VILFDTSILSLVFRRRRPGAREREFYVVFEALMRGEDPLGLPGIVLQEVLSGLPSEKMFRDLKGKLLGAFTIVHASTEDHLEAARLKNLCVGKGLNVSGIDCLIAATAILRRNELFTADTDFESISRISGLKLFARGEIA
jgi:predicted nucleic acid-binding protein